MKLGIESELASTHLSSDPPSYNNIDVMPSPSGHLKHHPDYYQARGNLTVQIGNMLFKVSDIKFWTHSMFFYLVSQENGTTLKDIMSEKAKQPTNDPTRVWKLKDVDVNDFTYLLWILYPLDHGKCRAETVTHWKGILKLADRWHFTDVFNLAVRELAKLAIDPVDKIRLMHQHKIRQEWVIDALVKLAIQPDFPDVKDNEVLGIEFTTYLAKTRERLGTYVFWNRRNPNIARQIICDVFVLEGTLVNPPSWRVPGGGA